MASRSPVVIRSYHEVLGSVERRLYRFERYRLPTPYGVLVRSLLYAAGALLVVVVASALPVLGALLGALPWVIHWALAPGAAWLLSLWAPDGRMPHAAARSLVRYWLCPRRLAALRRCPSPGTYVRPLREITVAPSGDGPRYPSGRVRGPAQVTLFYPMALRKQDRGPMRAARARLRLGAARRVRLRERGGPALVEPVAVHVPPTGTLEVER